MGNAAGGFLLLIMVALMDQVFAGDGDHERAHRLHKSGVIVPLEKVVAKVRAAYPDSKVLEAELKEHGMTYEIEIIDKTGVVRELYFNARSGDLLRFKGL